MRFGIFDHMDDTGRPVSEQYESRLQLIEAYDRCGFHYYHLAEHHGTPLGYAPSPSVFLAAVAQRTKKGLTSDVLNHRGEFYQFDRVPMVMKPVQRPHPPLWYGVKSPETTTWAA